MGKACARMDGDYSWFSLWTLRVTITILAKTVEQSFFIP
jgi:hypothetical protein